MFILTNLLAPPKISHLNDNLQIDSQYSRREEGGMNYLLLFFLSEITNFILIKHEKP